MTAIAALAPVEHAPNDLARILAVPRVELGRWPTPIDRIASHDVLVKRDDLSGHGRGGAKARKIELLIGHLLAHGHDELIATAGNVTNLAFDLLPALHRYAIRPRLFIIDDPPAPAHDRERIFEGIREDVELVGPSRAGALVAMLRAWVAGRAAGRRPFLALPGVSHPSGVIGNALGFVEMMTQLAGSELPRTVFVTAATGTTLAGFLLGENALRRLGWPPVRIIGVQIYPGAIDRWTFRLLRWTENALCFEGRVPRTRIEIVGSALGGGFGHYSSVLTSLCRHIEELGLKLDPIFGGKTWSVMETMRAREDLGRTLYWHCGYTPEWQVLGEAVMRGAPS